MSAVNCINQIDRISLIADAGYFDEEWRIAEIKPKITQHHTLLAAWAYRGGDGHGAHLNDRFQHATTFDQLIGWAAQAVRIACWAERRRHPDWPEHYHECDVTIIGWSEMRGSPEGWKVSATGNNLTPALTLMAVPLLSYAPDPADGDDEINILDLIAPGYTWATADEWAAIPTPEMAGRLVDAQRAFRSTVTGCGESVLAGFAEMVTVSAAGIDRQRIRDWPQDRIGEKVAPEQD